VLKVGRVGLHRERDGAQPRGRPDPLWTETRRRLIEQPPTFGYQRLRVLLRFREGLIVNRQAVYR
jgi:putative transposase